jgi:hypothetical protein
MTNSRKPTVAAQALLNLAASIERGAKDSLNAYIVMGETSKYSAAMEKASHYRHAAGIESVAARREYLANKGLK